jgi:small subunit ribosomal protein S4
MESKKAYKVCRRLGAGVYDKCQTQKFALSEARHQKSSGGARRRAPSDYGKQLLEKQRVRFAYGISEKQLRRYNEESQRVAALGQDPATRLLEQLEMRIDNIIYRAGLTSSRRAARQLVSHGHVHINGVRTTVPSAILKEGDTFSLRERTKQLPVMDIMKNRAAEATPPAWLSFDVAKGEGVVRARPTLSGTELPGSIPVILEFYSR